MRIRGKKLFNFYAVLLQISLLISVSFAFSFLISSNLVGATHAGDISGLGDLSKPPADSASIDPSLDAGTDTPADPGAFASPALSSAPEPEVITPSATQTAISSSSKAASLAKGLVPSKEFTFTSDFQGPIRVGTPVDKIIPTADGGTDVYFKGFSDPSHLNAEQYASMQGQMTAAGITTRP